MRDLFLCDFDLDLDLDMLCDFDVDFNCLCDFDLEFETDRLCDFDLDLDSDLAAPAGEECCLQMGEAAEDEGGSG